MVPEVRRQQREERDRQQDADERQRRPQRQLADRVGVVRRGTVQRVPRLPPGRAPAACAGRRGGSAAQHQERDGQSQQPAPERRLARDGCRRGGCAFANGRISMGGLRTCGAIGGFPAANRRV